MFIARKKFSLGEDILEPGDVLTDAMKSSLPPMRLEQLRDHGWLEEKFTSDQVAVQLTVNDLEARVTKLEALLNARRSPGRPRKTVKEDAK